MLNNNMQNEIAVPKVGDTIEIEFDNGTTGKLAVVKVDPVKLPAAFIVGGGHVHVRLGTGRKRVQYSARLGKWMFYSAH